MASAERILGIDPGLNTTGYGVVERSANGPKLIEAGVIRGGKGEMPVRLQRLHDGLTDVLTTLKPTCVAMEELYSHYERPRTAILMGHARGVLCLASGQHGAPVISYAATQVKRMLTGSGRAAKSQMQDAICREFNLKEPPEPNDVADALAIALCHYYQSRAAQLNRVS